jgi:beta-lactamase class A
VERDTGTSDHRATMRALADLDRDVRTAEYDPALASAATARDLTGLLAWVWRCDTDAMELVRESLAQQVWRHRIGSGFPHDDVVVAAKSGSLGTLRHEVAVVHFPGEVPIAVAVLTRAVRAERHVPAIDAAIGRVARAAVHALRRMEDA